MIKTIHESHILRLPAPRVGTYCLPIDTCSMRDNCEPDKALLHCVKIRKGGHMKWLYSKRRWFTSKCSSTGNNISKGYSLLSQFHLETLGNFPKNENHISIIIIDILLLTCNAVLDLKFYLSFLLLHFFEISTICYSLSFRAWKDFAWLCANLQVLPYNAAIKDSSRQYFKDWQQHINSVLRSWFNFKTSGNFTKVRFIYDKKTFSAILCCPWSVILSLMLSTYFL